MANLLDNPVYITAQDIDDTSDDTALIAESDAVKDKLITRAQYVIDDYLCSYGTPFVEGQPFIFPIDVDGVSTIPDDIKLATVYTVEYLYNNEQTTTEGSSSEGGDVMEEKTGDYTVKFSDGNRDITTKSIPDNALNLLNRYKSDFIYQNV